MYVPMVTYACDFIPGQKYCKGPLVNKILSPVFGVVGLFLCYLAHCLWHVEVFSLAGSYLCLFCTSVSH